jgi:hypothetical protein
MRSAVSLAAVFDGENLNGAQIAVEEKYAIIPDPQPQTLTRRAKFLHISNACCQKVID